LALNRAHLNSMLAALAQARASAEQSTAQFRESQSSVLSLDPLVAQRQGRASAIADAQYNYDHCRVYAPFDARVTNLVISQGAYAHIGQEIFTLIDTRVWWVLANFRETQLKHIQPGLTPDCDIRASWRAPDMALYPILRSWVESLPACPMYNAL